MRDLFVTLREFLWTVIAVLAAGALAAAVILPARFADRSAQVFEALQEEGFDIKIKTPLGEATFARVRQEIADSDAQALDLQRQLQTAQSENARLQDLVAQAADAGFAVAPEENMRITSGEERNVDEQGGDEQGGEGGDGQGDTADVEPWVVIAGTQRSLEGQRVQLDLLRDAGFDDVVILQVDGWFQTAVIYEDGRMAAHAALDRVSDVVGASRGAYIRALNRICPAYVERPGETDLWRCIQ